jgi:hypothetical protein
MPMHVLDTNFSYVINYSVLSNYLVIQLHCTATMAALGKCLGR